MFWQNYGRRYGSRPLWREMERLQREMNRLMDGVSRPSSRGFPALNVWANEQHALITAEIPGIDVDDLDISIVGDTLTLSGQRSLPQTDDDVQWHRHERWHDDFSRSLQLPFNIDADNVEATYEDGVLRVTLPRAEEDQPRQISVKSGGS
ncbi:MAG: Hsp20/alpha crystallin family protein [Candidatus Promineifilaceae bacterium]|nr:Hsp20/alpha crystallin family protein [Candidatus Promineifilaceae bacterium]